MLFIVIYIMYVHIMYLIVEHFMFYWMYLIQQYNQFYHLIFKLFCQETKNKYQGNFNIILASIHLSILFIFLILYYTFLGTFFSFFSLSFFSIFFWYFLFFSFFFSWKSLTSFRSLINWLIRFPSVCLLIE